MCSIPGPVLPITLRYKIVEGSKPSTVGLVYDLLKSISWSFYPAIISTCRVIHEEATAVLYGKNFFQFWVPCQTGHSALSWDVSIVEECENVFKHNDKDWRTRGPPHLTNSVLTCFLNRIGARNAASLKAMCLVADCWDVALYQFQLMISLLEREVLSLKMIGVFVRNMTTCKRRRIYSNMGGISLGMRPWIRAAQRKEFQSFCHSLTTLVRECPSLEEFDFGGDDFNAVPDVEVKLEYLGELFQVLKKRKAKKAPHLERSHKEEQDRL